MADTNEPGCPRADEKREHAGSGRKHVTSRVGTAATVCSAVFCGCAATVFLWAIPAIGGSGPAMVSDPAGPQQAAGGGAGVTSPPGRTVRYVLHVNAVGRNTVVQASAVPAAIAVRLTCPASAEGPVCRLSTAGPVDIPASVYVPVSFVPGTVIRITEVASGRSGVTVQDMVIQVVPAPTVKRTTKPARSGSAHRTPEPARRATPAPSGRWQPEPGHAGTPAPKPSPWQSTPDPAQPARTATPAPVPGLGSDPAVVPGLGGTPSPSLTGTAPAPKPSPSAAPKPSPGTVPAPGLGSPAPTTKPAHRTTPTAKPAHRSTPTAKPAHRSTATPKPSHSRTTPPAARARHSPGPVRSSHPAIAGFGHAAAPPGAGRGAPATSGPGPLPLPLVTPADSALATGNGQPNAGAINLPGASQAAPILPPVRLSPRVQQPSPLPLPSVTEPATDPSGQSSQAVVLPNRARAASSDQSSAMSLVEAQIIGLSIALGGALAALLRPVRNRTSQRPERSTDRQGADARRPRAAPFRALHRLRAHRR